MRVSRKQGRLTNVACFSWVHWMSEELTVANWQNDELTEWWSDSDELSEWRTNSDKLTVMNWQWQTDSVMNWTSFIPKFAMLKILETINKCLVAGGLQHHPTIFNDKKRWVWRDHDPASLPTPLMYGLEGSWVECWGMERRIFSGKNAEETAGSCVDAFSFPWLLTSEVIDLRDYWLKRLLT